MLSYAEINQFLISTQMQEEIDYIESIFSVMVRLDVVGSITLNYNFLVPLVISFLIMFLLISVCYLKDRIHMFIFTIYDTQNELHFGGR